MGLSKAINADIWTEALEEKQTFKIIGVDLFQMGWYTSFTHPKKHLENTFEKENQKNLKESIDKENSGWYDYQVAKRERQTQYLENWMKKLDVRVGHRDVDHHKKNNSLIT